MRCHSPPKLNQCDFCNGVIHSGWVVVWRGSSGMVMFHPECATRTAERLIRDGDMPDGYEKLLAETIKEKVRKEESEKHRSV